MLFPMRWFAKNNPSICRCYDPSAFSKLSWPRRSNPWPTAGRVAEELVSAVERLITRRCPNPWKSRGLRSLIGLKRLLVQINNTSRQNIKCLLISPQLPVHNDMSRTATPSSCRSDGMRRHSISFTGKSHW